MRRELLTVLGDGGTMLMAESVLSWLSERDRGWVDNHPGSAAVPLSELGGTAEVAVALGITRQAVSNRVTRGGNIPAPVARLAATPVWDMRAIRAVVNTRKVD